MSSTLRLPSTLRECRHCKATYTIRANHCSNCKAVVRKKRGRPKLERNEFGEILHSAKKKQRNHIMSEETKSDGTAPHQSSSKPSPGSKSRSPPSPSSASSPPQPLTDFMGMLKMKRSSEESHDTDGGSSSGGSERVKAGVKRSGRERVKEVREEKMETDSTEVKETLVDRFRRDPSSVLQLLESALSMDKLSSLLATEHRQDKKKVEELRTKLEAAYHTLKDCAEQKGELTDKIEKTNEKIKAKRKQLESLREELKVLGEEELLLKRKRDASYTNCADLKKKLKSSRDALQQLAILAPPKPNKGATSGEGSQNST